MYICGLEERLVEACEKSGLTKKEIARRCGFDRRTLYFGGNHRALNSGTVARFCEATNTDANWLLGLTSGPWKRLR